MIILTVVDSSEPIPKILEDNKSIVLPVVNQQVLLIAGTSWSGKLVWATRCALVLSSNPGLSSWLKNNPKRGTHLKRLYFKQLTFDENWNSIVDRKGGYYNMLLGMI